MGKGLWGGRGERGGGGSVLGVPLPWLRQLRVAIDDQARRPYSLQAARVDAVAYLTTLQIREEEEEAGAGGPRRQGSAARRASLLLLLGQPWDAVTAAGGASWAPASALQKDELLIRAIAHARCGALPLAVRDLMDAGEITDFTPDSAAIAALVLVGPKAPPELLLPHAEGWHQARRQSILSRHPEVKRMIGPSRATPWLLLGLVVAHVYVAVYVVTGWTFLLYAATFGSVCSYSFQALTHELWHQHSIHPLTDAVVAAASSLCNFPWRWYYSVHHPRHHADTGGNGDFDGIVLFRNWQSPPLGFHKTPLLRWAYTLVYGNFIFFFVWYTKKKLGAPFLYDWTEHGIPARLKNECTNVLVYFLVWCCAGWQAVAYLWWAAAFSLGAGGHPHLGFWLIQHQCPARRAQALFQPSSSYYGSWVWNVLNFGELLHVEHHDFPRIPWTRLWRLRGAAPEFYAGLTDEASILAAIWGWIRSGDGRWMDRHGDFAGQLAYWGNRQHIDPSAYDMLAERCVELGVDIPWATDPSGAPPPSSDEEEEEGRSRGSSAAAGDAEWLNEGPGVDEPGAVTAVVKEPPGVVGAAPPASSRPTGGGSSAVPESDPPY